MEAKTAIRAAGADLLIVLPTSAGRAEGWRQANNAWDVTVIGDEERVLYRALGVGRGTPRNLLLDPRSWREAAGELRHGRFAMKHRGDDGFQLGADDYVPKPFYIEELIARAQLLVARRGGATEASLQAGGIKLDRLKREVSWRDGSVVLSSREYRLLELLMRSPGHLFSRQQILQQVWDINFDPQTNVVDVCIQRMKRKIEAADGAHGVLIESVRGVGYRLKVQHADG